MQSAYRISFKWFNFISFFLSFCLCFYRQLFLYMVFLTQYLHNTAFLYILIGAIARLRGINLQWYYACVHQRITWIWYLYSFYLIISINLNRKDCIIDRYYKICPSRILSVRRRRTYVFWIFSYLFKETVLAVIAYLLRDTCNIIL